jgi:NADP-dependent 3-hydroxy acid dehydrogenase YdfG
VSRVHTAEPFFVISGDGPGTGTALVRRFASEGYRVAMLARTPERLADLAAQVPSAKTHVRDVSDQFHLVIASRDPHPGPGETAE